jgi:TolB-like protein/DNA-binding winged helix-turn-helix (wHTH) protein/tetratricopeptide (TPR) repeat protein
MAMPPKAYRFGPFELRPQTRELYKLGIRLKLRPQPFEVLRALLDANGEMVSREQLREMLWSSETFVDFDQSLNTCIKELRAALSDSAGEPRYIETLPKLGYRMIVPVERDAGPAQPPPEAELQEPAVTPARVATAEPEPVAAHSPHSDSVIIQLPLVRKALLAGAIVLVLAAAVYFAWPGSHRKLAETAPQRLMIAVLPFENLSGSQDQDYFSDGLTEEVITRIGEMDPARLGVIARTSVMHYKNKPEPLPQIAGELGVQYVLEGTVRRDAGRVRISAQLIQVKDQTQLWSHEYERDVNDLLALQDEMGHEMANELRRTLREPAPAMAAAQARPNPPTSEVYDLYLKGLYFLNQRTDPGFRQAIDYFQQAIAKDPNYARAYAGLADSLALRGEYSAGLESTYMPKARQAALRAVQLDDSLPEAHTALALVVQNYDWDWDTADKEFRRAIELNPNYATGHHWYAEHLMWEGRFNEALQESERARELDPLSLIIAADNGAILYNARQFDKAIAQFRSVLEMDPQFPRAHVIRAALDEEGRYDEALADLSVSYQQSGAQYYYWMEKAYICGRLGKETEARQALNELKKIYAHGNRDPGGFLWAYLGMGDKEKAFEYLQEAYTQRSNIMTSLKVEPAFDPLRGDPRFTEMLHRVHLDH